jgi:hypothetical protein
MVDGPANSAAHIVANVPGVVKRRDKGDARERSSEGVIEHDVGRRDHHEDTPDDARASRGRELERDNRDGAENCIKNLLDCPVYRKRIAVGHEEQIIRLWLY